MTNLDPINKQVSVFRLISKGTIEEMCYMRQIYKLQITSAAMGDQARGGRRQFNAVQVTDRSTVVLLLPRGASLKGLLRPSSLPPWRT